jgi:glycosyltransferase involved in cell wall biosynthesis
MPPISHAAPYAFLGTYVPRQCGIATFTQDVAASVEAASANGAGTPLDGARARSVAIVAIDPPGERLRYPDEVIHRLDQDDRAAYREAADVVGRSGAGVVSLQHEYGIFGGEDGSHVLDFIERSPVPVVSTLHTVRPLPTPGQRDVLAEVCAGSVRVVVMTDRAARILAQQYGVEKRRIRVIPHGAPDVPFDGGEEARASLGLDGRRVILTFGLIGPSKRIEVVLDAMRGLVDEVPDACYVVLGATHPELRRRNGEAYRVSLQEQAARLGLDGHIRFVDRYVDVSELTSWIRAADIFVTPYANAEQAVSGTLTYALVAGKAIVSTPYEHAQELLADGRGMLVPFDDRGAMRVALRRLLTEPEMFDATRRRARAHGRSMLWSAVGPRYRALFEEARLAHEGRVFVWAPRPAAGRAPAARLDHARAGIAVGSVVVPPVRRDHLAALAGRYGIYQHAIWSRPDPRHGFCTDDVARALILDVLTLGTQPDAAVGASAQRSMLFLEEAFNPALGRFRNFRADDGTWLEEVGSEDSHGRAIQALGEAIAHAPDPRLQARAAALLDAAAPAAMQLTALRPLAYAAIGCAASLEAGMSAAPPRARLLLAEAGSRLDAAFAAGASRWPDWPWPEEILTYDNAALPRALIAAGHGSGRPAWVDRGVTSLVWLVRQLTAPSGSLSLIGNAGWWRRNGPRARFDQQPIDAASVLEAADAAYRATADVHWLAVMEQAFAWFRGANDLGVALAVEDRGACSDGLTALGPNLNEGAESTLAWLVAVERMRARRMAFLRATRPLPHTHGAPAQAVRAPAERVPVSAARTRTPMPARSG